MISVGSVGYRLRPSQGLWAAWGRLVGEAFVWMVAVRAEFGVIREREAQVMWVVTCKDGLRWVFFAVDTKPSSAKPVVVPLSARYCFSRCFCIF